jgi:hypothetical protein
MTAPLFRFCINCKAGIAGGMMARDHDPLQLE